MLTKEATLLLSSSTSTKTSLDAIRRGDAGLNEHRTHLLRAKKLRLVAHTHSDYGDIEPSSDDREFLQYINQKESLIISYITGTITSFSANPFDDI